ncbi:MAG: hypothetical protein KC493_11190 [Bacteriovoracaceae bacterium]|nr:hypothetical protein [Bacteriovoracaceae bacterium]
MGRIPTGSELELGRQLFSDTILSRNNDVSCATCHLSNHGFADGNTLNVGTMGKGGPNGDNVGHNFDTGKLSVDRSLGDDGMGFVGQHHMFRNSLSTINVVYRAAQGDDEGLFHDGRFGSIQFQVLLPIHTSEEMCGTNPLPIPAKHKNPFMEMGPIFKSPVKLTHAHSFNAVTGADTGKFNAQPIVVKGVPARRPNGSISVPTRNECLAIAIAKLRLIPKYQKMFKEVYNTSEITDKHLSMALSSFVMTHVSDNSPYDKFVRGENSLSLKQLRGLAMFFTPLGQKVTIDKEVISGTGCIGCHGPPHFGGNSYASLGVRSDHRSPLSRPVSTVSSRGGFFNRPRVQRGLVPTCHIKDVTVSGNYAPDIGRANGSFNEDDCFKFRVPPLRNVIETYPYFHHGTETAVGSTTKSLHQRSLQALKNVLLYHLRGPISIKNYARSNYLKPFFDEFYQTDLLIPYYKQQFTRDAVDVKKVFPMKISDSELNDLLEFVSYGLWDKQAVRNGSLGNDISHPEKVLSGFRPSITRDNGNQLELPSSARAP